MRGGWSGCSKAGVWPFVSGIWGAPALRSASCLRESFVYSPNVERSDSVRLLFDSRVSWGRDISPRTTYLSFSPKHDFRRSQSLKRSSSETPFLENAFRGEDTLGKVFIKLEKRVYPPRNFGPTLQRPALLGSQLREAQRKEIDSLVGGRRADGRPSRGLPLSWLLLWSRIRYGLCLVY